MLFPAGRHFFSKIQIFVPRDENVILRFEENVLTLTILHIL